MDYSGMYYTLFNKITDVIEDLQQIQRETERMYVEAEDYDEYDYDECDE